MKNLKDLVRTNIWQLKPYSSARDEFHGEASVFLDANENPWNLPYNRYPDPLQWKLKTRIAELKKIDQHAIFVGNGSDEAIDLIIRAFCEPGINNIATISPSYGMYEVAADINHVACLKVPLTENFELDGKKLLEKTDICTKVIFLCSPNNPSGNLLEREEVYKVLNTFQGIVVIDEAYIDFASEPSFIRDLSYYPNLVVLQTLSKAWGAAGIRLGMAFASPEIISVLNKIKYPYNVNQLTQEYALKVLSDTRRMQEQLKQILNERERLTELFSQSPFNYKIYPSDANFILVEVGDADRMYQTLIGEGVVVRNRNNVTLCKGCLRITIGTPDENEKLLKAMKRLII
ncbi:histidinol-phosphate transaminase [Parabacteroides sp. PF5-9]|uniref:histidinol-phosphate transaminase n=1 Tax=Parabacteroides sp. PF5-9 TaxID=1742404 RepID=UPI002475CA96|nr:histidinol-phosphate transaminase [Parabacteroides sp. PF5-9]MDH6358320.1 histidinol-phosphate aminotransferase [Parabacteroides sp. PF5-9]